MSPGLTEKILALHEHLGAAGLPHAFGGALALAFCTAEPRATRDVDVNVFVDPTRTDEVLAALPAAIATGRRGRVSLERDGQARLWWDETPVDVFLSNHPFHERAEEARRTVPFAGLSLPVLACDDLAVFKAFYARPKDALDLATMAAAGTIAIDEIERTVAALLGPGDRRTFFRRVREMLDEM